MGEFDIAIEDLFTHGVTSTEEKWFPLQSRKSGKKKSVVTGEVLLQFSLFDPYQRGATDTYLQQKFMGIAASAATPGSQ